MEVKTTNFDRIVKNKHRKPKDTMTYWDYFLEAWTDNFADYYGRARRKEFWSFHLISYLIFIGSIFFISALGYFGQFNGFEIMAWFSFPLMFLLIIFVIAFLLASLSCHFRRFHDVGISGWLNLLTFVPFGFLVIFIITILPSQNRANNYGPSPK
jgi:uncharacterized membrane protein YhaH (DUF805 family)